MSWTLPLANYPSRLGKRGGQAGEPDGPLSTWAARTAALEVLATLKALMVA